MQRTATLNPPLLTFAAPAAARLQSWLQRTWEQLTMDADELYIRGATDLADLEYRQRRVARGRSERFGPLGPSA